MQTTVVSKNEKNVMIQLVSQKLLMSGLNLTNPEMIARSLLSHYDYNLEKVLELAV